MKRMTLAAAAVALGALALPSAARAQGANLSSGPGSVPSTPPKVASPDRPDALPGAKAAKDRVTPAERPTGDMEPTDELFDAINRGDISSARDAISRGADLQGHNLLGMSPLELSVDLGRNDITFLILSYRGVEGAMRGHAPLQSASADAGKPGHPMTRAERRRAAQEAARARAATTTAAAAGTAGGNLRRARSTQYASDGGTPVPSAGFLGFDPGQH